MTQATKQTQIEKVKTALLNHEPVNSVVMFNDHITRLASVIERLRARGYPIITKREKYNGLAHYSLLEGWQPDTKKPR